MECLHCGDCCRRMPPPSMSVPCSNLIEDGTFFFCNIYEKRPIECENHEFHSRFCPIGMDVLKLSYPEDVEKIRVRLEIGYLKTRNLDGWKRE